MSEASSLLVRLAVRAASRSMIYELFSEVTITMHHVNQTVTTKRFVSRQIMLITWSDVRLSMTCHSVYRP